MYSKEWHNLPEGLQRTIAKFHSEFPIKVGSIAKELGIEVKSATLGAGISGEIKRSGDSYIIRINRHDVKARQRFTVAHEIAHYLLHKDKIGDGIVDDILYRSLLSDDMEAQANRLAADIIMPLSYLKTKFKEYHPLKEEEKIEKIANDLEVSITAIKIRLGK